MKHERVTILTLAYVIGFITAFIGFGINQTGELAQAPSSPRLAASLATLEEVSQSDSILLSHEEDGLYARIDGLDVLVTAFDTPYSSVLFADVSPSQEYIYFCKILSDDNSGCVEFVYDVATATVHPVTDAQGGLKISSETQVFTWLPDSSVEYGGLYTASAETPWLFE